MPEATMFACRWRRHNGGAVHGALRRVGLRFVVVLKMIPNPLDLGE